MYEAKVSNGRGVRLHADLVDCDSLLKRLLVQADGVSAFKFSYRHFAVCRSLRAVHFSFDQSVYEGMSR